MCFLISNSTSLLTLLLLSSAMYSILDLIVSVVLIAISGLLLGMFIFLS